jgi:hypothetical protein
MATILDTQPDVKAYTFSYRFQVGHALRATHSSELRIEQEHAFEEVRLFLDPGHLVDTIETTAEALDANVSFRAEDLHSGEVREIPVVEWRSSPASSTAPRATMGLSGLAISIPAGTELVVAEGVRVRFPRDTDIGVRANWRPDRLRGFRPVILNGIPLLEVSARDVSSVGLLMTTSKTAILTLFGVVSPYRHRGAGALVHVMEAVGGRIIGGTSIRVRV